MKRAPLGFVRSRPTDRQSPNGDISAGADARVAELRVPPSVPDHELLRIVGRGAYGEVWLARNILGQYRAVKIVHRRTLATPDHVFEREFEGIKRFEPISRSHPSQLAILHVGRHEAAAYFYYVMELADGAGADTTDGNMPAMPPSKGGLFDPEAYVPHTLRLEVQRRGRLPVQRVAEIGLALTEALGHLHRHGLVHRDVKPSNIVFVHGSPKLADIGLVTDATDECSIVGTEGYLPPEGPGMPAADIFALGKVLYEAVTGLDRRQFPRVPDDVKAWSDHARFFEINELLVRACAATAGQRYPDAKAMHSELERLAGGGSLRRVHRTQRRRQLICRGLLWSVTTVGACGVLLVGNRIWPRASAGPTLATGNGEATPFYRTGLHYLEKNDPPFIQAAITNLQQAVEADPGFARAQAALAMAFLWSDNDGRSDYAANLSAARAAACKAVLLDPSLPEPHIVLGWCLVFCDWNWNDAEQEFKRAIREAPSASSYHFYAEYLRITGRTREALTNISHAMALEPGSLSLNRRFVDHLIAARKFEKAIRQAEMVVKLEPQSLSSVEYFQIRALCALGRFPEAIVAEKQARLLRGEPRYALEQDARALLTAWHENGANGYWRTRLTRKPAAGAPFWDTETAYWKARAYAQAGDKQSAIRCLKTALSQREFWLTFYVVSDWALDPLRSEPEFQAILRQMHLKQAPQGDHST